jgi:hypothetical protein
MKQTITKNDKSLRILNKLINNGFYKGYVGAEKFELKRNYFPNNHRIFGVLNDEMKYEVTSGFEKLMKINANIALILGVIMSIVFVIKGNWIMSLLIILFGLIFMIIFKLKEKNELELFTNKFLEFYKIEQD